MSEVQLVAENKNDADKLEGWQNLPNGMAKEDMKILSELRAMVEPTDGKINEIYRRHGFHSITARSK